MKCIKVIKKTNSNELGTIRRVDDKEAETRVKTGNWAFCPKSEWKALRKPIKVEISTEEAAAYAELSIEEKKLARKKRKK